MHTEANAAAVSIQTPILVLENCGIYSVLPGKWKKGIATG
jgi:hypothetical protein